MADRTRISWTNATINPVTGCTKISPGCEHCYAIRGSARQERFGTEQYKGSTRRLGDRTEWSNVVKLFPEEMDKVAKWKKPRMVFPCSMSDLFHRDVPDEFIHQMLDTMESARRHTFQVLTKRTQRMADILIQRQEEKEALAAGAFAPPLDNVWPGTSVEDQIRAWERVTMLLTIAAKIHWLSLEPLLGPVDLSPWLPIAPRGLGWERVKSESAYGEKRPRINWVVVGGESGPDARPMHPNWVRATQKQCEAAGVAFYFKQWGAWEPIKQTTRRIYKPHRYFEFEDGQLMFKTVKKSDKPLLDGVAYREYPKREMP